MLLATQAGLHAAPTMLVRGQPLPVVLGVLGVLLLTTLAIRRFSLRLGAPAILGVLLFGLLMPNELELFQDSTITNLHTIGGSVLLFYAGLQTEVRSVKGYVEYGVILAFGGVAVASTALGLIIWTCLSASADGLAFGFNQLPISVAMLTAACLGSTDAGATMSVLADLKDRLPERLRSLLEFESALNDASAILFLGLVTGLVSSAQAGVSVDHLLVQQVRLFVQSVGSGVLIGVCLGYFCRFCLDRLVQQREQLLIFGIAFTSIAYGSSTFLGGSGFICAYVTGLFLSNHTYKNPGITADALQEVLSPFNTMMEMLIFLVFGLTTEPEAVLPLVPIGVVVALAMMLIARPLSVLLFQPFSPFNLRESLLVAWCGLRGAVPLALALEVVHAIPELPGVAAATAEKLANNISGLVFMVVLLNLLVQGLSLPWVCRQLGLAGDEPPDTPAPLLP